MAADAKIKPIDLTKIKTYRLSGRPSKVDLAEVGRPWEPGGKFSDFLDRLPDILGGKDFRTVVAALNRAAASDRTVMLGMGAHPIKVGLSPIIIDLIDRGMLSSVSLNGAGIIHDSELAMIGRTSEDVEAEIKTGLFGMAQETGREINRAISRGAAQGLGLGASVGKWLVESDQPHLDKSILAAAYRRGVPVTVHVAVGTDIIHMHPDMDGAAVGLASHRDFKTFTGLVAGLEDGVYINLGSAVILPEVFLKAITLARNLGYTVETLTTVNLDFIKQYRPMTNVVHRPTTLGGQGLALVGQHEILFPLLVAAWLEASARG